MPVLKSKDEKNLIINCCCSCDEGIRFQVDKEDCDMYVVASYMSGNFYKEQAGCCKMFKEKMKKIWKIIRNKDFYYSEVCMTKEDFKEFKEYINSIE